MFFLTKSESDLEVEEEISTNSIRKKDWRPVEYGPSYVPDKDPDNMRPNPEDLGLGYSNLLLAAD